MDEIKVTVDNLDDLRYHMKTVTQQIVSLINQRMEIAKKIGELKSELNLNVVDDKVEQEIRNFILQDSNNKGLDPDFSGRILNLLINESVMIQNYEKNKKKLLLDSISNKDKVLLIDNSLGKKREYFKQHENSNSYGCI